MNMNARDVKRLLVDQPKERQRKREGKRVTVQYGYVSSAYTAGTGRPNVTMDNDGTTTTKKYPYISTYTPAANDRIMIIDGVIMGKIL